MATAMETAVTIQTEVTVQTRVVAVQTTIGATVVGTTVTTGMTAMGTAVTTCLDSRRIHLRRHSEAKAMAGTRTDLEIIANSKFAIVDFKRRWAVQIHRCLETEAVGTN